MLNNILRILDNDMRVTWRVCLPRSGTYRWTKYRRSSVKAVSNSIAEILRRLAMNDAGQSPPVQWQS
ncbi:hypothetical protein F4W66_24790 (plasmid) [Escherichia coli]|nr:hypothetical protein F4W66_24790 [Escherichia coli]